MQVATADQLSMDPHDDDDDDDDDDGIALVPPGYQDEVRPRGIWANLSQVSQGAEPAKLQFFFPL